jgi:hypothetical protein
LKVRWTVGAGAERLIAKRVRLFGKQFSLVFGQLQSFRYFAAQGSRNPFSLQTQLTQTIPLLL